jgi:hypothetical protein
MTCFGAVIVPNAFSPDDVQVFHNLVNKLRQQWPDLHDECREGNGILLASKMWLPHSRTRGFAECVSSRSWLAVIGNPTPPDAESSGCQDLAAWILQEYLDNGRNAITSLNAPFVVVLFDGRDNTLNVVTDRAGLQHIYIGCWGDRCILSTSSLALASVIPVHLDSTSLANYFLAGYLLGQNTFFSEITKVGPATWLTICRGQISAERYWAPPDENDRISFADASASYAGELQRAVSKRIDPGGRTSLELTGGLDTRLNLACVLHSDKPFHAWTIGQPQCKEASVARSLKQVRDFPHYVVSPGNDFETRFLEDLQIVHTLTDGEIDCINLVASPSCNRQMAHMRDCSMSGFGGEVARGVYYITHKGVSNRSGTVRTGLLISLKILPNINCQPEIFSRVFPTDCHGLLKKSVEDCFVSSRGKPLFWRLDDFFLQARDQRFVGRCCTFNNYFYRAELPFFDNDVIIGAFSAPWTFKKDSKLLKRVLTLCGPDLAELPLVTGLPARSLTLADWYVLMPYYGRLCKKLLRRLRQVVFHKSYALADDTGLAPPVKKQLATPEIQALLNPDNMASAFLYDARQLRQFVQRNYQNGFQDRIQVGLILSFEMTCRYVGSMLRV